jgi:flagellin-like hook-associated protein FlgL
MLSDHYTRRVDELKSGISDVEEVDLAEAIQQYQLAKNVYNAALSVASKGYDLSLMDFIN